ncbi:MAG: hypothetical protein JXB33_07640 [Clostridia bacterium]|nr:hypothetical protein [Clostridia bacterium]
MKSHYRKLLEIADRGVEKTLKRQCLDAMDPEYGGFPEMRKGFSEPANVIGTAVNLAVMYYNEDSKHHRDSRLLNAASLAMDYGLRKQHEDGTIDLVETNFHCASTIGFSIQGVVPGYRVIKKYSRHSHLEDEFQAKVLKYIEKSADGMKSGGFHTPNHRWVLASALALCSNELGRKDLLEDIDLYLNEGIDCNEYGEWTERSAGIYNKVNNDGMIILAEELGKWELLDHVGRNLYMMFTYLEPDDSLFTMNSHRQDFGQLMYPMRYYENYLMTAHYTKNKHFAYMADYLFNMVNDFPNDAGPLGAANLPTCMHRYMLNDFLRENELEKEIFDWTHYEKFYGESNIVRKRCGDSITTIMGGNPSFLRFQQGRNVVMLRYAASFFGTEGRFTPDSIVPIDGGYRLHYRSDWGYVRPLGKPDRPVKDGHTNIEHRERVNMQFFDVDIDIFPMDDGVRVELDSKGVEDLPCKLELIFQPGGFFDSAQAEFKAAEDQHIMVKFGGFKYMLGNDTIEVDGAFAQTNYHAELRGSLPPVPKSFTVYFTGWSPTKRTILIKGK